MNIFQQETHLECRVFKTNVEDRLTASRLIYILEHSDGIKDWNLDMEDCDHVLRIDFQKLSMPSFLKALSVFGIEIEEMPIW